MGKRPPTPGQSEDSEDKVSTGERKAIAEAVEEVMSAATEAFGEATERMAAAVTKRITPLASMPAIQNEAPFGMRSIAKEVFVGEISNHRFECLTQGPLKKLTDSMADLNQTVAVSASAYQATIQANKRWTTILVTLAVAVLGGSFGLAAVVLGGKLTEIRDLQKAAKVQAASTASEDKLERIVDRAAQPWSIISKAVAAPVPAPNFTPKDGSP